MQLTVFGNSAFRKYGQQITLAQHFGSGFKGGIVGRSIFAARRNRDRLAEPEQPSDQRHFEDLVVHHKVDGPRTGRHQQHRIHETDVVAHQHGWALCGYVFVAGDAEAIDKPRRNQRDETQQILGHQHEDVERHQRVGDADKQENLRDGVVRLQQRAGEDRADDHEQRVENVVGGNDARAVRGLASQLDQRIHRHAVEARKKAEQRQVHHYPPVSRRCEETANAHELGGRQALRGKAKINRKHAHANGAEGHKTDLDVAAAQHLTQQ